MSALTIRGVRAGYGPHEVLRGVDLDVASGTTTAVLGPSGCGKTTLLRVIAGFVTPSEGAVRIGDLDVVGARVVAPERRGVGLVPQEGALFPYLDVGSNVGFGLPRGQRRGGQRVAEALELVGLAGSERRAVAELSGGQQQRVALARALAPRPRVVLLDEPFSALDAGLRESVRAQVRAALQAAGATAVIVTHDQDEALSVADSVAVMRDGVVAMHASPGEVYAAPADLGVARFVGGCVTWPVTADGGVASTPLGPVRARTLAGGAAQGAGTLMLRPEQVRLGDAPGAPDASHGGVRDVGQDGVPGVTGAVDGTVTEVSYFGHDWVARVRPGSGGELTVRGTGAPPTPGPCTVRAEGPGVFYPAGVTADAVAVGN